MEKWLPVPGYENLYEVSNEGRVWSKPRSGTRGGVLDPWIAKGGYLRVGLWKNGKLKLFLVHQLVMKAFIGDPPENFETRHLDDNPTHNFLTNLAYGTHSDNERDKLGKQVSYGENCCPSGHLRTTDNTYHNPAGFLACRECQRIASRKYRIKKKAATLE